jgi:putative ABC transport system permease protein
MSSGCVPLLRGREYMILALEELQYRRGQFALITLIVTMIAYLVVMMGALGAGLLDLAGSAVKNLDADVLVFRAKANLSLQQSEITQPSVDAVKSAPGVGEIGRLGYVSVQPVAKPEDGPAAFIGYEPGTISAPKVRSGRGIEQGERGVVLADKRYLETRGASVGDVVQVLTRGKTTELTIVGSVDEGSFFFQAPLWGNIDDWQELKYGAGSSDLPVATLLMVKGSDGLRTSLPQSIDGIEVATPNQVFENIPGVSAQRSTANSIQGFGLVIGALVIGAFFYVLTLQKIGQIGVLKALGASSWFIFQQLMVQVIAVTVIGLALAVPVALLTVRILPGNVPLLLEQRGIIISMALILAMAIVGVAFSGREIASVDALIALGQQQ